MCSCTADSCGSLLSAGELFGETGMSLCTFHFSLSLALAHTHTSACLLLLKYWPQHIQTHKWEVHCIQNFSELWPIFEILNSLYIFRTFPSSQVYEWVLTIITEWTDTFQQDPCLYEGGRPAAILSSQQRLLCLNRNWVLYAQEQKGVRAVMSEYTLMSPLFTKNYS